MSDSAQQQVAVVGVGSPLMDLILHVDDDFLGAHVPGAKGGMEYRSPEEIQAIIAASGKQPQCVPGGAAANTTKAISALGVSSAFVGSVGADAYAEQFRQGLLACACEPRLQTCDLATGHVLSLVTPDAQRTMRTCLGAAVALDPAAVQADWFVGAEVVMLEGYTLFNHQLTQAIASAAKEAGARLALDLASFEVVQANRDLILGLLDGQVDVVFANEDEAKALLPEGDELAALRFLAERCTIAVVKVGADGAWIRSAANEMHVAAAPVAQVLDTTGAGDTWAAGFLAGLVRGLPLHECGEMGAQAAAAVVQVSGASVPAEAWLAMRGRLDAWA
ncbi:MAG: adenosine kinase [Planctomycetota bacterium]|nr:MAG: adenosine kinase [Planctomycetota bacterium]